MEETTWATISIRFGLIVSFTLIRLYLVYQSTALLLRERAQEKKCKQIFHFAILALWYTVVIIFGESDPGLHADAQEREIPEARQLLIQTLQGIGLVIDLWILLFDGAVCILSILETLNMEEPITGEEDLRPALLEELVWIIEDAQEAFLWRLEDIGLILLDLVEELVFDLLTLTAPVLKAAKS